MSTPLPILKEQIGDYLSESLATDTDQATLESSISCSLVAGGKRLHPALMLTTIEMLGGALNDDLLRAVSTLELPYTYSLIHNDLPAMSNDDLRHGRPTNHCKFEAGMATLAGDGLLTLVFQWAIDNHLPANVRGQLTFEPAKAAGPSGMVAGQARDVKGEHQRLNLDQLKYLHRQKTRELIRRAVLAGEVIMDQSVEIRQELATFGENYELAFQIYDDLMNVLSTTEEIEKATHKDANEQKNTYPGLLGIDGAEEQLQIALMAASQNQENLKKLTDISSAGYDDFLAYFR